MSTSGRSWPFLAVLVMKSTRGCPTATCDPQASFAMASTEWLVFGPQGDIEKDMSNAVITERQQYWLDHIKAAEDREGTLSNK